MGSDSLAKVRAIPLGVSPEDRQKRAAIYKEFDQNGNGYLSLAEIDKGVRDVLQLPELFDAKPVEMRAYQAARGKVKGKHPYSDDFVSKAEFRFLLIYLRQYYEYWIAFETLDIDGERRISEQEFVNGKEHLENWGIKVGDPKATFEELLKKYNANSHITFTQFTEWAIAEHLKLHIDAEEHDEF